jgi:hypothetical protein
MIENYSLLERHLLLHGVCSIFECHGRLCIVHVTLLLKILEHLVESFDDVLRNTIIDYPQASIK